MSQSNPRTVIIVGAGFSGVMVAAHLLRAKSPPPLRVVMLNRSGRMARGVAYGTNSPAHLLNVAAGRMSAYPDDPEHFLRFLRETDPDTTAARFVPRSLYGEYLQRILADAEATAAPNTLQRIVGEAISLQEQLDGIRLTLGDGAFLHGDHVVLAIGHYPPSTPWGIPEEFASSRRYIRDPWGPGALREIARDRPALLIGTGLTALDVALDLDAAGLPKIIALSRRGLLPRTHEPSVPPHDASHFPPELIGVPQSLSRILRAVRRTIFEVNARGGDWRQVLDSLRPHTPRLWRAMTPADRERFFRHLRPYWDAHRHRVAPATATRIQNLIASGWMAVRAGRFTRVTETGSGVMIEYTPKGTTATDRIEVGTVINCTGPAMSIASVDDPLLKHLITSGIARPDPLSLGIEVSDSGSVIAANGSTSARIHYVGPFLRARDGEGTAVPELRVHAAKMAELLTANS